MIRRQWRTRLKACAREADVLQVVEAFLGEWTADELRKLPIRARALTSARDVCDFSSELGNAHARYNGGPDVSLLLLQEMLLFFTQACVRVTQLRVGHGASQQAEPKPVPDEA